MAIRLRKWFTLQNDTWTDLQGRTWDYAVYNGVDEQGNQDRILQGVVGRTYSVVLLNDAKVVLEAPNPPFSQGETAIEPPIHIADR